MKRPVYRLDDATQSYVEITDETEAQAAWTARYGGESDD